MADYDLGTAHGKITLDYNGDKAVAKAENDIDKLKRKADTSDGSLSKLGKTLKGLGKGVALGGMVTSLTIGAIQAAALTTQILGMVPALASIASLSALLPAYYVALGAAVGVVKASLAGVSDAIKAAFDDSAAGTEKFNKALEELSPNARAFAVAVRAAAPALKAVQQGIQDAFFSSNLQSLLPRLLGGLNSIRPALNGLASDFGRLAKDVAGFVVDSDQSWEFLETAILEVRKTIIGLSAPIQLILQGLRSVGVVGLGLFPRLRAAIISVAEQFGLWLNEIASNGKLEEWINTAIETLKTLGTIIANVFGIFNSIVQAAEAQGGGLLQTIAEMTTGLNAFLSSAEGAAAVGGFFASVMAVAKQLVPLFTTLATALLQALAPAMLRIAQDLGPILLQVIEALAPAFGPLAAAVVDLATAIAPLLPPLAQLVALLVSQLATGLSSLSTVLGPTIALFGGAFATALQTLAPLVAQLAAEALPLAASLGVQLLQALMPLAPVIVQVAEAFAKELAPSIPAMVAAAAALTPSIVELAKAVTDLLLFGLKAVLPYIPQIVDLLVFFATAGLPATKMVIGLATALTRFSQISLMSFVAMFKQITALPGIIGSAFGAAWDFIKDIGGDIGDFFGSLGSTIGDALSSLGSTIVDAFGAIGTFFASVGTAIADFITSIPGKIAALPGQILAILQGMLNAWATGIGTVAGLVVGIFTKLPQRIADALVNLVGVLRQKASEAWTALQQRFTQGATDAGNAVSNFIARVGAFLSALPGQLQTAAINAWNALRTAFINGVNSAVAYVQSLITRARAALNALPGTLSSIASTAWARLRSAFTTGVSNALAIARALPGKIRQALGDLKNLLLSSGRRIIDGLVNGISGGINRVMDMVRGLANRVRDAFNNALEIFSPSRIFFDSGVNIDEGVILGIRKKLGAVRDMAKKLANSVIQPTIGLPAAVAPVSQTAAYGNPYRSATEAQAGNRNFGPYKMLLDGKVVSEFVIDAITGNPKVVKKASDEGSRQAAFA